MNALRGLARLGALDLRALALFRITLAGCVLYDVATRLRDFHDHYSDAGLVPVSLATEMAGRVGRLWLPVWAHQSDAVVAGLFALLVLSALALGLGFRTRVASVLCWLLVVSLQVRNPLVSSFGGDTVLRVLLFWAMLLPLGRWYSLDARRGAAKPGAGPRPTRVLSMVSVALLVQVTVFYVTTGFAKYGGTWASGTGLFYALQVDYFGNGFGAWLREQPALLGPLNDMTLIVERYGVLLLFVPVASDWFRMAAVLLFVGFHLGLALFMDVGPFPLYSIALWPAFLPGALFDDWLPRLRGGSNGTAASGDAPAGKGTPVPLGQTLWIQLFAAGCLVFVVAHVATNAQRWRTAGRRMPAPLMMVGKVLQLQQNWDMFGPNPPQRDIWPLVAGRYRDGRRLDLMTGAPYRRHKPEDLPGYVGSFRARLYFRALYWGDPPLPVERLQEAFARSWCRRTASDGDDRLTALSFAIGVEDTRESGPNPIEYLKRGRVACPADDQRGVGFDRDAAH